MSFRPRNPVFVAAGCGGTGSELAPYLDLGALGGFVTRSITRDRRRGDPGPRIVESPSGLLNAVGLQNPGVEGFLASELPWLVRHGAAVYVSVAGATTAEYAELVRRLALAPGVAGIELNLSVPDAAGQGLLEVRKPADAAEVVAACRHDLPADLPLLAKLGADPGLVVEAARAAAEAGADAVVLTNAVPARMPDGRRAGLSGPAIGPIARRCVDEVTRALPDLPVVGVGGVRDTDDARALLDSGAVAVQIGTALLHDPTTAHRILQELT